MRIKNVVLVAIFTLFASLLLCSCNTNNTKQRIEGYNGYDQYMFEMPSRPDRCSSVRNILLCEDDYLICVLYFNDDDGSQETVIYRVNEKGEQKDCLEMEGYQIPDCVIDDHPAFLSTDNKVILMDSDTGGLYKAIDIAYPDSELIVPSEDGFVVLCPGRAILYDNNGNELGCVVNELFSFYPYDSPYFVNGDSSYLVIDNGFKYDYWLIDFNIGTSELVSDSDALGVSVLNSFGKYVLDNHGEYIINPEDNTLEQIADWNDIDMQPERYALSTPPKYYAIDDFRFSKTYEYKDGSADILLFDYNGQIDHSTCELITVGGYGTSEDLSLRWSVYLFNTSHDDYRINLVDYAEDYGFSTGLEAQDKIAELLVYFEQGNAPDIFYGNEFDFIALGNGGMVQDLTPYIETDAEFDVSSISPSIASLLFRDDQPCYQIFSSYVINGYWGLAENFTESDVSIYDLEQISSGTTYWGSTCATDIADFIIRYPIMEEVNRSDCLSEDSIREAIDFSVNYGIPTSVQERVVLNGFDTVCNGEYLLSRSIVRDVYGFNESVKWYDEQLRYIGYPSIDGSTHPITPDGLIAMSSGTPHPDICWEFMKYMFSDTVQMAIAANQRIPVNQNVLDAILEYAYDPQSGNSTDYNLRLVLGDAEPISIEVIQAYEEAVNSVDTIILYDWGMYNIICEEIDSYEINDKPSEMIAESMYSRLYVYSSEYSA